MTSAPPSSTGEWRRGWPVVMAAMLGIGTNAGLYQNLSSLFTPGITAEFGWSRGDIATAAGIGLIGALAVPLLGRLVDWSGPRPMIVFAMLLLGGTYVGMSSMTGPLWQYQLLVLGLALTVPGTSSLVYGKLIGARFVRHRGIAFAVANSGLSVFTLGLSPLIGRLIAGSGWRAGGYALAALTTLIALPIVLLLLRGVGVAPTRPDPQTPAAHVPVTGLTAGEGRRSGRFWRLSACATLVNIGTVGLVTQLVPLGIDRGLSPIDAAWLVTAFGAAQMVGRLGVGAFLDRFSPQLIAAGVAVVSAFGFAGLAAGAATLSTLVPLVFIAGLMGGADNDILPFFGVRLFGLRAYGEIYGMLLSIALFGNAIGIVGYGRLHDVMGDYHLSLWLSCAGMLLAALLFLSLRDRALPAAQGAADGAVGAAG